MSELFLIATLSNGSFLTAHAVSEHDLAAPSTRRVIVLTQDGASEIEIQQVTGSNDDEWVVARWQTPEPSPFESRRK